MLGRGYGIKGKPSVPGQSVPTFSVRPPYELEMPREITVKFTQIQYTQLVLLNFAGLTWPHVSVNTLVPPTTSKFRRPFGRDGLSVAKQDNAGGWADHRILWSVWEGLRPAKFHEKLGKRNIELE